MSIQRNRFRNIPIHWGWLLLFCFSFLASCVATAQTVTLTWDRSTETNIAGYKIYYGPSSRNYPNVIDTGNNTAFSISNLLADTTYYFAVTAYNNLGIESDFSSEVSHAFFQVQPPSRNLNGMLTITWASTPLAVYVVLYKDDLSQPTWTVLSGTITATGASTSWVDATAGSTSTRFYKIERLVL